MFQRQSITHPHNSLMEKLEFTVLGCTAALPTAHHNPSSGVLNVRDKLLMFDCGEGTQRQFRKAHLKFSRLNHIFVTHLHGDHCFGLPGLISSLNLLGRSADLHIYSPEGLEPMIQLILKTTGYRPTYSLIFHTFPTDRPTLLFEDRSLTVSTVPLAHRVPCCGFIVEEKPTPRHILHEAIVRYEIPTYEINRIKNGEDFITADGRLIANEELTRPSDPPRRFAYITDTAFLPTLVEPLRGVDLLYHEATFMHSDLATAQSTMHTTALQAGQLAAMAGVKQLLIGHFSNRYEDEDDLLREAASQFPHTIRAQELLCLPIR